MFPAEEEPTTRAGLPGGPMAPAEQEVARGLRFAHLMIQAATRQADETLRFIEAAGRLLAAKGIISEAERTAPLQAPPNPPP